MAKKTKQDPTGQARNRKKGELTLDRRLVRAEREVKALFRAIPRERRRQTSIVNQPTTTTIYDYQISDQELASLAASVAFILNQELLETQTGTMPANWYWQDNVELPYRQGTAEEVNRFNQIVAATIVAGLLVDVPAPTGPTLPGIPPAPTVPPALRLPPSAVAIESVLFSEPYRQALNNVFVSNFSVIKNLSERTSAQVIQQLNLGIQAGNTPTDIAKTITERFDVSRSSAERIARTEVNKAYNDAKINAVDIVAQQTGLRAGVIHTSALIATTRAEHAARHGNAYTTADQLQWWNSGSNRINCLCTTQSVLIDKAGKVVQSEFQDEIKAERAFFDPE